MSIGFADALFNIIGLIGVGIVVIAYFLQQRGIVKSTELNYLVMNIMGPMAIIISLMRFWNLPSFLLNLSWMLISMYGLIKRSRKI